MAKRKISPPRPGSWRWAKHTIRAAVVEFNAYADFTRVGAPRGGGRTVVLVGVNCPLMKLECTPIPEPVIDRLADALGVGGAVFRRIGVDGAIDEYTRNRAVRTWWEHNNPAHPGEFLHSPPVRWRTDSHVVWAVRMTVPEELCRTRRKPNEELP